MLIGITTDEINALTVFVTFVTFFPSFAYLYGTLQAIRQILHKHKNPAPKESLKISVLKPMHGVDPALEHNLTSFAKLDVPPEFEVILCMDDGDPAFPIARRVQSNYPDRFKIVVGSDSDVANHKIALLSSAAEEASNDFLWVSDSNVEATQETVVDLMSTWLEANTPERRPTLVHAGLMAVGGRGIGGALERAHLAPFQNCTQEMAYLTGAHAVVGKSMFMRKDDLALIGGFEAFGNYLGEDYMIGKAFQEIGEVRCAHVCTRNVVGNIGMSEWFMRYSRWAVLRKTMEPVGFHLAELFIYTAIPMLLTVFGVVPWRIGLGIVLLKMLIDTVNIVVAARKFPRIVDILVMPLKELLLLGTWMYAATTLHVKWRNKAMRLGHNSFVLVRGAEPSKMKRHWNTVKRVFLGPTTAPRRRALRSQRTKVGPRSNRRVIPPPSAPKQ